MYLLHLAISLIVAYLAGSVFATRAELFSFNMDNNFTVGILTGGCLAALKYFSVI